MPETTPDRPPFETWLLESEDYKHLRTSQWDTCTIEVIGSEEEVPVWNTCVQEPC